MVQIDVYADEASGPPGGLPLHDSDDAFVAAAFAVPSTADVHSLPLARSTPISTAQWLQRLGAHPEAVFIRPFPGYTAALHRRCDLLSGMGLTFRRRWGVTNDFLGPDGVRAAAMVWTGPMTGAVLLAVQRAVWKTREYPDRVRVFLDAKSLPHESVALVKAQMQDMGPRIQGAIAATVAKFPANAMARMLVGGRIDPACIDVEWESDDGFSGVPGALHLADSLASGLCQALRRRRRRPGMLQALAATGYGRPVEDVTRMAVSPPHPSNVTEWERATGLVLPGYPSQ